jgi:hypothetical protein
MAGRGRAPKLPDERRNRSEPQRGEWIELRPLERPVLPALPRRGRGEGQWSPRTRRVYEGWRSDPVTATFGRNEIAATVELAFLQEELARGKVALASEIRQRADGLGLPLKGKRDLRFRVVGPGELVRLERSAPRKQRHIRAVE